MVDITRDLDRYIRQRKPVYEQRLGTRTWWEKMFTKAKKEEHFTPEETTELEGMEEEIEHSEEEIEALQEYEDELEQEQEKRVSLYHQVSRFFARNHEPEPEEEIDEVQIEEDNAREDFRRIAELQMKWFDRLPLRAKMDFKDSDDRKELLEILERRGAIKRK